MSELQTIDASDELSYVSLKGRLDIAGVDAVAMPLTVATVTRRKPTIVDMSAVEFLGSLGIGMLVRCAVSLQRTGARFVLFGCQPMVRKTLETSKVDAVLPIADTKDAALALLHAH